MYRHFLHALDLRAAAHTGYGDTYIDGRTEALVEQVSFEEYLSVGDGNHIRRDVGGHVACLCLDDRECRERTSAFHFSFQAFRQVVHLLGHFLLVDDFGSTFQQAGVQVEDVAGVSFATRRTAQDERNLAVATACLERSSNTTKAWRPVSRKYSPMAAPANGAKYCNAAGSAAVAATTTV